MLKLSEYLKKLRMENDFTQKQLSDYLGVDVTTYAHYESGRRSPNYEKLRKIAEFYHMDDELLGTGKSILEYVDLLEKNLKIDRDRIVEALEMEEGAIKRLTAYAKELSGLNTQNTIQSDPVKKSYLFKEIYSCKGINMRRIFPTKQLIAKRINEEFKEDSRICCIILFGSSVTMLCNQESDTDLLVRLNGKSCNIDNKNDISERIQEITDWKSDILWYDRISREDRIYSNILKGVQIV